MPRARNIKPSFFTNEELIELPPHDRLLFIGLWTIADRDGRLEDRPKRIKMQLFPADDYDVNAGLNRLASAGFIQRYTVNETACVLVVNFTKHQSPHLKEAASTLPAPDEHRASTGRAALNPESPFLNPDVLNPEPIAAASPPVLVQGNKADEIMAKGRAKKPKTIDYTDDFETFWTNYPKTRGSKAEAFEQWQKLPLDGDMLEQIEYGLSAWHMSADWLKDNGAWVMAASRWLNKRFWESPPSPANVTVFPANGSRPGHHIVRGKDIGYSNEELMRKYGFA